MNEPNLMFGITAVEMGLIDQAQFAAACTRVAAEPQHSIADVLLNVNALTEDQCKQVIDQILESSPGQTASPQKTVVQNAQKNQMQTVQSDLDDDLDNAVDTNNRSADFFDGDFHVQGEPQLPENSHYKLNEVYAEGGLSRVWVAEDTNLNRKVALKQIRHELSENELARSRFHREAQVTGQLEHPHIVPVYEMPSSPDDDLLFYTMRLVEGDTLLQACDQYHATRKDAKHKKGTEQALQQLRLLQAFVDVCQAIAFAHSRGVIHRDIKPENVVLGNFGEVVVLDWGLSKTSDDSNVNTDCGDSSAYFTVQDPESGSFSQDGLPVAQTMQDGSILLSGDADAVQTVAGAVLGTPAYMAPEQVNAEFGSVDHRTDVYGLGATLFHLLTGMPPHRGPTISATIQKVDTESVPPPKELNPHVEQPLDAICVKAMSPIPKNRYQSANELAEDIQRYLADEPVTAYPEPVRAKLRRFVSKHRTGFATAVALLVATIVAMTVAMILIQQEQTQTEFARRDAEILASEMTFNQGLMLCQQGKIGAGLLWFSRCLQIMPSDATDLNRVVRTSIASWQQSTLR